MLPSVPADGPVALAPRPFLLVPDDGAAQCFCGAPLGYFSLAEGTRVQMRCRAFPCHRHLTLVGTAVGKGVRTYVVQSRADRRKTAEGIDRDRTDYDRSRNGLTDPTWPHALASLAEVTLADLRLYLEAVNDSCIVQTRAYESDVARLQDYVNERAAREQRKVDAFRAEELRQRREAEAAAERANPTVKAPKTPPRKSAEEERLAVRESESTLLLTILARKEKRGSVDANQASKVRALIAIGSDVYLLRAADLLGVREVLSFGGEE